MSSSSPALAGTNICVLDTKLEPSVLLQLRNLASTHGKLVMDPKDADVVITAIRMRARLERHLDFDTALTKAVVKPQWLFDSVAHGSSVPCKAYAALAELQASTEENCPSCGCEGHQTSDEEDGSDSDAEVYMVLGKRRREKHCMECDCWCKGTGHEARLTKRQGGIFPSPPSSPSNSPLSRRMFPPTPTSTPKKHPHESVLESLPSAQSKALTYLRPPSLPITTDLSKLRPDSSTACQRACPLTCVNQGLVEALDIIRQNRYLEGEARSELSYMRAIGVIKAQPKQFRSPAEVARLPFIGPKIARLASAYIKTGTIPEVKATLASGRFVALCLLSSIYGIGPTTARVLYARGVRTIRDLCSWYDVDPDTPPPKAEGLDVDTSTSSPQNAEDGTKDQEHLIRAALVFRADLEIKIERAEVEASYALVAEELEEIQSGCISTICGGYRRGKLLSNDVDIVFTHPDTDVGKGLCQRIVERLVSKGLITHVLHYAHVRSKTDLREHHFDGLEKAFVLFGLPTSSPFAQRQLAMHGRILRRRVDIIFAEPKQYWTAIVGWTGSTMFQRDLRWWAKHEKSMKFDSAGITRRRDTKMFYPKSEEEVFTTLGLEHVGPEWRNADA